MNPGGPHRLPRSVLPQRYDLELAPDLDTASFEGRVCIDVVVESPTDVVVLNAVELEIDEAWCEVRGERVDARVEAIPEEERVRLVLDAKLPAGDGTVCCRFRGVLNDKLVGFYRSTYTGDDGVDRIIATTQMEATHARRAFPCWDEPDLKAVFAVTLVVADDLTALSNEAVVSVEPAGDGLKRVRFADTMTMSTYLVAFVVGSLEVTEPVDVRGVPLRVAHVPGKADLTGFALEVGAFGLEYLADYYGIAYPSSKLDLVALPDFAFGAMENLGCVTFRETLLLADTEASSRAELERIVDVVSHEIAHMWFGDLVTMRWWNGIWLNEAFATFMELKTTDAFRPDWNRWGAFGTARSAAFDTDALSTTRAIEFEVESPVDAEAMFDVLTYEKGASVVRMLEQYLGEEPFRRGVAHYLRTHLHGNTETTDLWDAIESVTGEPVRQIMDSWIFQGGFPLVEARVSGDDVIVEQRRFGYQNDLSDQTWLVPLQVTVRHDGAMSIEKHLLGADPIRIDGAADADVVNVNSGGVGFFRSRYDDSLSDRLRTHAIEVLSDVERFVLVDDTWAAVTAGSLEPIEFVEVARCLRDETDLTVWTALLGGLRRLVAYVGEESTAELREVAREVVDPVTRRLGPDPVEGELETDRELRARLFGFAGTSLEDGSVIESARRLVDAHHGGRRVEPSMLAEAERVVARWADAEEAGAVFDRFRTAPTPQERIRVLNALAHTRHVEVLDRLLDMCLVTGEVKSQNVPFVLADVLANQHLGAHGWRRIRASWDELIDRLASSTVPRMVSGIRAISDPRLAADVRAFLAEHPLENERASAQHVERMEVTVALAERVQRSLPATLGT